MRNRRIISLALTLMMSLAALFPISASAEDILYDVKVYIPSGFTPVLEDFTFQPRSITEESPSHFAYSIEQSITWNLNPLPLGSSVAISNLRTEGDVLLDTVMLNAWSDPDGDGIYDQRACIDSLNENGRATVIPLTGKDTFTLDAGVGCWSFMNAFSLGFYASPDESGYMSVTMDTDRLCELFGANTVLGIWVYSKEDSLNGPARSFFPILLTGETYSPMVFTDVPDDAYYAAPVRWAVENGITAGTTQNTFSPGQTCTTAQILTFLWRAYGQPEPKIQNPFTDIVQNNYYYKAALWAYEMGLVGGSTFNGNNPCTRSATMTYFWKLSGSPKTGSNVFVDVPNTASYAQAVAWAVEQGVTSGTGNNMFSPDDICTRGQIVSFLYRYFMSFN